MGGCEQPDGKAGNRKGKKMKLTTEEAKHLIEDLQGRQEYDALCDYETAILYKVRQAYPLAAAELEIQHQRHMYEQLGKYNGELVEALKEGTSWEEFRKGKGWK